MQARRPPSKVLALVNPGKRDKQAVAAALGRLREAGVSVDDVNLQRGWLPEAEVVRMLPGHDAVVVVGGDGTVHRYARTLLAAALPVGIIPAGTANDLARTLGLPTDARAAADVLLGGEARPIDLGEVNGHPFFNVASIGMSVDLAHHLSHDTKRRWGRAAYAITAARVAVSARPFHAEIVGQDGAVSVATLQIAVGNGRYYGGGLAVEASAAIDDGHLHLYSLEMSSAWSMLPMLWAFRRGTHGRWASVRTLIGDAFEVRTRRPRPVNADGEIVTTTPCTFRILPAALRVLVPRAAVPEPAQVIRSADGA